MVRTYKRKPGSRKYRDYSEETIEHALQLYRQGRKLKDLSEKYNIPYVTLYRKAKGKHTKPFGGQTALSIDEETYLVRSICTAADWGYPCDSNEIKEIVKSYLDRSGKQVPQFSDNKPGETWLHKFLQRHKETLSKRLSQTIKESRAEVCPETINNYFDHLSESLQNVTPEAVVNYDETNFTDDPGRVKVLVRRSSKRAEKVMDTSKAATSVMFSCSASGNMLPVYIVYKADHLWSTWTENGPNGARYNRTRSGWFDTNTFEDWFFSIILPYLRSLPPGPKVLLGDNLASHISAKVISQCANDNIRFILLPPNSTHLTQPLDVSVFRPIKTAWRKTLQEWKKHNKGTVRKDVFPRLLNQTLNRGSLSNEQNIKSGFEATGLLPLNRQKVLSKLPKTNSQKLQEETGIVESLREVFERSRFKAPTSVGRKKKLSVEAGKSISQEDLQVSLTAPSKNKKPKKNSRPVSSSESDVSEENITIDSDEDLDPETFDSDGEDVTNEIINEQLPTEDFNDFNDLKPGDYIFVDMKTEAGTTKQYVAKIISCEGNCTYLCTFLRKSAKVADAYISPEVEDISIVAKSEIKQTLLEYDILRRGQIKFKDLRY